MSRVSAVIAVIQIECFLPYSDSLKGKRRIVKSITQKIQAKFNAAVAEIDYLDKWQRAGIGIALIGNDHTHLNRVISTIEHFFREVHDIELTVFTVDWR